MIKTVLYNGWQMECCGIPFHVGDTIKWPVRKSKYVKQIGDIAIDFEEEHHDDYSSEVRMITGKVESKLLVFQRYKQKGLTLIPIETMLIDSKDFNADVLSNYDFTDYIAKLADVEEREITRDEYSVIWKLME